MDFPKVVLFVLVSVLGYSHCAYVDTLNKCKVADKECHKVLIQKVIKDISNTGLLEHDIPAIDPLVLANLKVDIFEGVDFTLLEGTVKGVKDCVIENTDVNVEHRRASIQLTCDITIKGKYVMKSTSPFIKKLFGSDVHGEGIGKVKCEKITLGIEFPFEIKKRGDDTFLTSERKNFKYTFDIKGKVTFAANNLYLGDKESSKEIVPILNDIWKTLLADDHVKKIFDIALDYIYKFLQNFFNNVPTSKYFIDADTLA